MFKTLRKIISDFNASRELSKHIPQLAENAKGLKAGGLVNLLYSEQWERFFWIKQVHSEILELTKCVEALKPSVVVEVGTNMGGSLFLFTKVSTPNAYVVSIDLPGGMGGGGYPEIRSKFYRSFATAAQKMELLRANSHEQATYNKLVGFLAGRKIDFLFLDGDHSYEGIKMDFEMYSPLVRSGGKVAFHDIKPSLPDNWRQVGPFWEEIKGSYEYEEFISNEVNWGGIGVITIP